MPPAELLKAEGNDCFKVRKILSIEFGFTSYLGCGKLLCILAYHPFIVASQNAHFDEAIKKYSQALNYVQVSTILFACLEVSNYTPCDLFKHSW
jgi:hypothetical protein